jgi:hypothetical protein
MRSRLCGEFGFREKRRWGTVGFSIAYSLSTHTCSATLGRVGESQGTLGYSRVVTHVVLRLVASQRGIAALKAAAKLSRDHAAALWLYTCESALYRKLNELLRARNRAALMAGFFPYLRLLLEAFAALETSKPRMVNRGVARDLVAAHPELYAKGSELTWWGFSSTTKDIAVLQVRSARCAAQHPRARRARSGTVDGAALPRHYPRRGPRRTRCSSARPATARSSRSSRAAASTSRRSRRCAERRRRGSHAHAPA